jgi:hypothetical protein
MHTLVCGFHQRLRSSDGQIASHPDGNLRVEIKCSANVATTINGVVYAVFDNMLEVNKRREVSIDY